MIELDIPKIGRRKRLYDKIMARVTIDEDGCWIYVGGNSGKGRGGGYPRMKVDGGTMAVHIVMWELCNGPIPPRKQLDHQCRKRMCIRPEFCTEMVTHKQNQKRRAAAQREAREKGKNCNAADA